MPEGHKHGTHYSRGPTPNQYTLSSSSQNWFLTIIIITHLNVWHSIWKLMCHEMLCLFFLTDGFPPYFEAPAIWKRTSRNCRNAMLYFVTQGFSQTVKMCPCSGYNLHLCLWNCRVITGVWGGGRKKMETSQGRIDEASARHAHPKSWAATLP